MSFIPFKIVLVDPQIPQNTGNIARLCSCTASELYIVGNPGFRMTDKYLKRAGLDYWNDLNVKQYRSIEDLQSQFSENSFYFLSTKAQKTYTEANFKQGDFFVFGSETKGLSSEIIENNKDKLLKIPMVTNKRSLNLSNSVSIVLYEAIRQTKILE